MRIMKKALFINILVLLQACNSSTADDRDTPDASGEELEASTGDDAEMYDELYSSSQFSEFTPQDIANDPLPYFVILGGNLSCRSESISGPQSPYPMKAFKKFEKQMVKFIRKTGKRPRFMLACYGSKQKMKPEEERQVFFVSSLAGDQIITGTETALVNAVKAATGPYQRLIIAGHSYGGWLSMQMAHKLIHQRQVGGLFTIDPISAEECNVQTREGCQRAPEDLDASERQRIADWTGYWKNFYQERSDLLHSGKIIEADENEVLGARHLSIAEEKTVWLEVFRLAEELTP